MTVIEHTVSAIFSSLRLYAFGMRHDSHGYLFLCLLGLSNGILFVGLPVIPGDSAQSTTVGDPPVARHRRSSPERRPGPQPWALRASEGPTTVPSSSDPAQTPGSAIPASDRQEPRDFAPQTRRNHKEPSSAARIEGSLVHLVPGRRERDRSAAFSLSPSQSFLLVPAAWPLRPLQAGRRSRPRASSSSLSPVVAPTSAVDNAEREESPRELAPYLDTITVSTNSLGPFVRTT